MSTAAAIAAQASAAQPAPSPATSASSGGVSSGQGPIIPRSKYKLVFLGDEAVGKCWGPNTKLMMFNGTSKKVKKIVAGDKVKRILAHIEAHIHQPL